MNGTFELFNFNPRYTFTGISVHKASVIFNRNDHNNDILFFQRLLVNILRGLDEAQSGVGGFDHWRQEVNYDITQNAFRKLATKFGYSVPEGEFWNDPDFN